jgi:hypothetical protein
MTIVRGKAPVQLTATPVVSRCGNRIKIKTGGFGHGHGFTAEGELSVICVKNLILDLRIHLRALRDDRVAELNRAVENAEKPLP